MLGLLHLLRNINRRFALTIRLLVVIESGFPKPLFFLLVLTVEVQIDGVSVHDDGDRVFVDC